MPERTVEEIRKEIAAERQALGQDLAALRFRLRWLALIPVAIVVVKGKGAKVGIWAGLKAIRKLI